MILIAAMLAIWLMTWVLAILGFLDLQRAGQTSWAIATLLVSAFFCPFAGLAIYLIGARRAREVRRPIDARPPP